MHFFQFQERQAFALKDLLINSLSKSKSTLEVILHFWVKELHKTQIVNNIYSIISVFFNLAFLKDNRALAAR